MKKEIFFGALFLSITSAYANVYTCPRAIDLVRNGQWIACPAPWHCNWVYPTPPAQPFDFSKIIINYNPKIIECDYNITNANLVAALSQNPSYVPGRIYEQYWKGSGWAFWCTKGVKECAFSDKGKAY